MKNNKPILNLWGSAFTEKPDHAVIEFTAGRDVNPLPPADQHLLIYDIWLNKAHCVMLFKTRIITKNDALIILKGLLEIEILVRDNKFILDKSKEDVHTNIESWLIENYGIESAGKLHTARSRNDQVVTDTRLYIRDQILFFINKLDGLIGVLTDNSMRYQDYIMPGFTHHQHAMVTTFGHFLASFVTMLLRDSEKLKATYNIINSNPLGSTASFGTSFMIDRQLTTDYLGFTKIDLNSLDAITNRGEPEADLAYCLASMMNHLSILAESLIIFSTPQFSFVKLSDRYSTGSSIMPQKKNPDTLEVVKGKTAMVHGNLLSLLTSVKGAFVGYNRDSQWTKYIIIDIVENCRYAPEVISGIIDELEVDKEKMAVWSDKSFIGATGFLEQLCHSYNLPFRQGKIVVEKAIRYSKDKNKIDSQSLLKSLQEEKIDIKIDEETVAKWQNPHEFINIYSSIGSPSKISMNKFLKETEKLRQQTKQWLLTEEKTIKNAINQLDNEIRKILS